MPTLTVLLRKQEHGEAHDRLRPTLLLPQEHGVALA